MEIKNFKSNKKSLGKTLKQSSVAIFTGACLLATPVAEITVSAATSYTTSYSNSEVSNVLDYFFDDQASNIERYLEKSETKSNLTKLLTYYDTLYDYINNNKTVKNTKYSYLDDYDQSNLQNLLDNWGNDIYDLYKNESYFRTTCNDVLGFTLNYRSNSEGYDYDHNKTTNYYMNTLRDKYDDYMIKTRSQSNLSNILKVYKQYLDFIKGSVRNQGYVFSELTLTEQETIYRIAEDLTAEIEEKYSGYSYYASTCIKNINWTVNVNNFRLEMSKYYNSYDNYYPSTNYPSTSYPNDVVPPVIEGPTYIEPQIINETPEYTNNGSYNTTPNKDWHSCYDDPSVNTSNGEWLTTPEYVNDGYYNNGYYNYNDGYYNNGYPGSSLDGYTEDYAPEYVYRP